jgi:hypothetical protein
MVLFLALHCVTYVGDCEMELFVFPGSVGLATHCDISSMTAWALQADDAIQSVYSVCSDM